MPRSTAMAQLASGAESPTRSLPGSHAPQGQPRSILAVLVRKLVVIPATLSLLLISGLVVAAHLAVGVSLWWLALGVACSLLIFALALLMARRVSLQLSSPLSTLAQLAGGTQAPVDSAAEVAEIVPLTRAVEALLQRLTHSEQQQRNLQRDIELSVKEIDVSNHQLSLAQQQLAAVQNKLIANQRMASLGELVAEVAHEINTPVGVGITAASTLKSATQQALDDYRQGVLSHAALERLLDSAAQSSDIVLTNLHRAAELIKSFKQLAVDRSNNELRRFALRAHIGELLVSLRPQLEKAGIDVQFDCDGRIQAHSFPGAVSQILTNLIMNSLLHAYPDGGGGTLRLQVIEEGGDITLIYSDDGCGISPPTLERMFDPFFTTRRDSGGSGLGMHIVVNLLNHPLCGTLDVESQVGCGTTFTIVFPADISAVSRYGEPVLA